MVSSRLPRTTSSTPYKKCSKVAGGMLFVRTGTETVQCCCEARHSTPLHVLQALKVRMPCFTLLAFMNHKQHS